MINPKQATDLIDQLAQINAFADAGTGSLEILQKMKERLHDDVFRVAVVGEFSSGKSTFINALMGADILTHAVSETTAAVTRICHVPQGHPKQNSCEIMYHDGKMLALHDLHQLSAYTTVQSGRNVADEIRCVTVWAHFMDTQVPLTVIDTPGLNGLVDRHREITMEEVKSAHACIYLLPLKGVTASDMDNLRLLRNYQSTFIFVQNFIDEIHTSEGETVQQLLDADKKAVEQVLSTEKGSFHCRICGFSAKKAVEQVLSTEKGSFHCWICGLSALQALAARDTKVTCLYEGGKPLAPEDRKNLNESSGFGVFEAVLHEIMQSGRYRAIAVESVRQALRQQVESVLEPMEERNGLMEQLRQRDKKNIRIENAGKAAERLKKQQGERERNLRNFIISRDKDNRKGLKEFVTKLLEQLERKTADKIDRCISNYDDLEGFAYRWGNEPPVYFSQFVSIELNGSIIPKMNRRIRDNLQHLYEEALRQAEKYSGRIVVEEGQLRFKNDTDKEEFVPIDRSYEEKLKELETQKSLYEKEVSEIQYRRAGIENREAWVKREIQCQDDVLEYADKQYKQEMAHLGQKPQVKKWQEKRYKKRKGFGGSFIDFFMGQEVYYVDMADDSEQQEWMRKADDSARRLNKVKNEHRRKTDVLKNELLKIEGSIRSDRKKYASLQERRAEIQQRIEREKEMHERFLSKRKKEYCDAQKNRLKESFRSRMTERDNPDSLAAKLEQRIDKASSDNLRGIQDKAVEAYRRGIKKHIRDLELVMEKNTEKLDRQYHSDKNDIEKLKEILDILTSEDDNERL